MEKFYSGVELKMKVSKNNKTRKRKRSKKKVEEVVTQDLTSENAKIEMIERLLQKTELTEEELNESYDGFYEMFPCGEINEQEFLQISKVNSFKCFQSRKRLYNRKCLFVRSS